VHTDPELLALLALGEPIAEDERQHAETCLECAAELADLRRVVTLGRSVEVEPVMASPGAAVWASIRAELGFGAAAESAADPASTAEADHELTAHARLTPVGTSWSHASGTAELATDDRGRRVLQVALRADLPTTGVRQAWLVHRDDPTLRQSLGILDGPHGLWTVAHSIDLAEFAILDISQQGTGETEHSGQTIVRGEFTLVS